MSYEAYETYGTNERLLFLFAGCTIAGAIGEEENLEQDLCSFPCILSPKRYLLSERIQGFRTLGQLTLVPNGLASRGELSAITLFVVYGHARGNDVRSHDKNSNSCFIILFHNV